MSQQQATEILHAVPELPAQDIDATVKFYRDKLGFEVLSQYADYVIMTRGVLRLHFWLCSDRHIAENTSCYIYVRHIDSLYAEFDAQGVIHPGGKLEHKPWGVKEFRVLDNNGNSLRIGEVL